MNTLIAEYTLLLENAGKLYAAAGQLASEGKWLTQLNLITIVCGVILVAVIIVNLRRRQQNDVLPILLFIVGVIGIVIGFRLYGIVGTPMTLQWFTIAVDEAAQSLLVEAKRISAPLAALSVVGLVSGIAYVTVAGIVVWNHWRQRRRERQQESVEVVTA